jgi:hypothetical protein
MGNWMVRAALVFLMAGCGSDGKLTGEITVAITAAPAGAASFQFIFAGADRTVTFCRDVVTGQPTVFNFTHVPIGNVTVSENTFTVPCFNIAASTDIATGQGTINIAPAPAVNTLTIISRPDGTAKITVNTIPDRFTISTAAGTPGVFGASDTPPSTFQVVFAIASNNNGIEYAVGLDRIRQLTCTISGCTTSTIGPGAFNTLRGIAILDFNHLVVTDSSAGPPQDTALKLVTLVPFGVTVIAGGCPSGCGLPVDGVGTSAQFSLALGNLAFDGNNTLYLVDANAIRTFTLSTTQVTTLAGSVFAEGEVDGTGTNARFAFPAGLALDGAGSLYVSDGFGNTIRKINLSTLEVRTIAGSAPEGFEADGVGASAGFNSPGSLSYAAIGGSPSLLIADSSGQTLRRLDLGSLAVVTIAGVAGTSSPFRDGPGFCFLGEPSCVPATFSFPRTVVWDSSLGTAFIGDDGNRVIRSAQAN